MMSCEKKYTEMIKLPPGGAAVAFNECLSQWSDSFLVICMMQFTAVLYNHKILTFDEVNNKLSKKTCS